MVRTTTIFVFWLSLTSAMVYGDSVEVSVAGVSGAEKANVLLLLEIHKLSTRDSTSERAIRRAHNKAGDQIKAALQPFGYYMPGVRAELIPPTEKEEEWVATYVIDAGRPATYRGVQLEVQGLDDGSAHVQQLFEQHPFVEGEPLDHTVYGQFKGQVLEAAYSHGFLDARFSTADLRISEKDYWADIVWNFVPGKQYLFGDVAVEQDVLNDRILSKLVEIEAGEVFKPSRLVDAQLALTDTAYFSTVEIDVKKDEAEGQKIPVIIKALPSPARKYSTYLGYGTDTGPRVGFGTEFRRINKRGHQFSADARISPVKSSVATEYGIPIGDIKSERLSIFAAAERADVGDAETDQYSVGTRIEDGWLGMRRQLYVTLQRENYQFGDGPHESATLLTPGLGLSWQRSDAPLFTRRGIAVAFDIHGGDDNILSDTTFVQTTLGANVVLPLGSRGRLLLRGELGATFADDFASLPPSQRFFTGGDRTVRGYSFESLSPENMAGDEIGGEYLTVASIETDFMLRGDYGLALFYDIGSAADGIGQDLSAGVGIGFRYRSPVGLIRVDLAHPLDDPDTDFRLHLTFGPDL